MIATETLRRGICPSLGTPMLTGDGLIVRFTPEERRLTPRQLTELARAAEMFGNGLIEITARGNLQIRGLTEIGVERLTDAVRAIGLAVEDGLPIDISPLAGIDPLEIADARPLARRLRAYITETGLAARLGPKVTVVIDGGGWAPLCALKADIRLTARDDNEWQVDFGGTNLGLAGAENAASVAADLLTILASGGVAARATDWKTPPKPRNIRPSGADPHALVKRTEIIGVHRLKVVSADAQSAIGFAPAFGQVHAAKLIELIATETVAEYRLSPGRAILALDPGDPASFSKTAERLGFVVRSNDPRLRITACAGSTGCASGLIPARRIAERIAELGVLSHPIHVSGCSKGCAHPSPAAMTIVGTRDGVALILNATARDEPVRSLAGPNRMDAALRLITERAP
jgi:precorrin-3B synthase